MLSERQEKAQQIYFHKWSITANALKLCLILTKRNFIRSCFGIISIVTDTETEMKLKKEARKRERGAKMKRGEKENRMEERKKDEENTRLTPCLLLHLQKHSYYQLFYQNVHGTYQCKMYLVVNAAQYRTFVYLFTPESEHLWV
ncbi:hypothetical protein ATANTOWER_022040 [Ataeniobius toweri]|uniref:Uncharacterized protein n=1 Tax=Ataeniobius toweri TaxID=208326 RepID=A0ABU7AII9_9TELE|nr:hypothetical protein [Ataeniobius toweri]